MSTIIELFTNFQVELKAAQDKIDEQSQIIANYQTTTDNLRAELEYCYTKKRTVKTPIED